MHGRRSGRGGGGGGGGGGEGERRPGRARRSLFLSFFHPQNIITQIEDEKTFKCLKNDIMNGYESPLHTVNYSESQVPTWNLTLFEFTAQPSSLEIFCLALGTFCLEAARLQEEAALGAFGHSGNTWQRIFTKCN